ncbi:hypothetical protein ACVJH7_006491 [Bradyrhizobium elkanii]
MLFEQVMHQATPGHSMILTAAPSAMVRVATTAKQNLIASGATWLNAPDLQTDAPHLGKRSAMRLLLDDFDDALTKRHFMHRQLCET